MIICMFMIVFEHPSHSRVPMGGASMVGNNWGKAGCEGLPPFNDNIIIRIQRSSVNS